MARKQCINKNEDMTILGALALIGGTNAIDEHCQHKAKEALTDAEEAPQAVRLPRTNDLTKQVLSAAGVVFGENCKDDKLFLEATIPAGWSIGKTDHYMHNELLDERGQKRAHFMYKAAFYDRDASLRAEPRYYSTSMRDDYSDRSLPIYPCIKDSNGRVVWRGPAMPNKDYKDSEVCEKAAQQKLFEVIPAYAEFYRMQEELEASYNANQINYNDYRAKGQEIDRQRLEFGWNQKFEFPPSESEPPKGDQYSMYVRIYSDGRQVDSGEHLTTVKETDKEAIDYCLKAAKKDFGSYSYVDVSVKNIRTGETIHSSRVELNKPKPKSRNKGYDNCCYDSFRGWQEEN